MPGPKEEHPDAAAPSVGQPDAATDAEEPDRDGPDIDTSEEDDSGTTLASTAALPGEQTGPARPEASAEEHQAAADVPSPAPVDGYYFFQGTSMAAPHVAGAAALIISRGVTDPAQVRAVLQRSARPRGPAERYGAGRLDAAGAVRQADAAWRDFAAKLALGLPPALLPLGLIALRRRRGLSGGLPVGFTAAIVFGWLVPDALAQWLGYASPWHLVGHSILLPGLLLVGLEGRRPLQWVALFAGAVTLHLCWDLGRGITPHATGAAAAEWPTTLWLVTNAVMGVGITLAALRRAREG
jgi:hypothetical protein